MGDQFFDFYEPLLEEKKVGEVEFSALDFETTGLYPDSDRIIEVGILRFRLDAETGSLESFIDPRIPIPLESSRISGINDSHVAGAPVLEEIIDRILALLEGTVVLAHNLNFDYGFLSRAVETTGRKYRMELGIDTVALAKQVYKGRTSYSLQNLAADLNLPRGTAHRALDDARLCAELFRSCLTGIPGCREMTAGELFRFSGTRMK